MPNWKKVVTSGSNAELNALTMSGNIIPDTDNTLSIGASDNRFLLNGGTPVTVTGSGTANTITRFQGATTVEDSKITSTDTQTIIEHDNSGSSIFIVSGANGQMLSISDEVGEKLLTVNNSSGLEVFSVSASGNLVMPNLTYSDTEYVLSYDSGSGIVRFVSSSASLPDGVVSGSSQTIAHLPSGTISGSGQLPSGTVSGSSQIVANLSNQDVDFGTGTVTATTFSSSLLRLDEDGTGLRLTNVGGFEPTGSNVFNIFGNNNVIFKAGGSGDSHKVLTLNETSKDVEVENAVSASEFSGSFHGDGSGLTGVSADGTLSGSAQIASDISGSLSNTAIAALGAGIFSGSGQLPSGTVSGSSQTIANLPSGTISGSAQLPSGTVSGSAQTIANLPSGTVSGSSQTIANLPSGTVSGSAQTVANLPSGMISGSATDARSQLGLGTAATAASTDFVAVTGDGMTGNLTLNDSVEVRIGTGADTKIYHNGTNTYIDNYTNDLYIQNQANDKDIRFLSDDGSGGITEYIRLDGGSVAIITSKNQQYGDSVKAMFGAGNDMQLYHNGSHSFITNTQGSLYLRSNNSIQLEDTSGNNMLTATDGGAIGLFYNAVEKLATTSGGVDITGDLDVSGTVTANKIVTNVVSQSILLTTGSNIFGDELIDTHEFTGSVSVTGSVDIADDLTVDSITLGDNIIHDGDTNTYFGFHGVDRWRVVTGGQERIEVSNTEIVINDGSNELDFRVESDNNANMLFVDASADKVGIGTNTPGAKLDVNGKIRLQSDAEHELYHTGSSLIKNSGRDTTVLSGRDLDLYAYDDINIRAGSSDKITFTAAGTSDILVLDTNGVVMGSLSNQASETTALVINGSNVVGTRELGGGAFLDTAAISDGGTGLATADQIHTFVTGLGYTTNTGTVDTSGTPADNDFAKFTDANTVEGRSYSEVKSDLSLNNVTNESKATMFTSPTFTGDVSIASKILHTGDTDTYLHYTDNNVEINAGGANNVNFTSNGAVFNEGSADIDFRVESNGQTHMLFVDGGNDRVGIKTNTPSSGLHVNSGLIVGGSTYTKATSAINTGNISLDNGGTDTGGIHFYYGNNTNFGIDVNSSKLRFVSNLDESGGAIVAQVDTTGLLEVASGIAHYGDINNYLAFGTDTQDFYTAGVSRLSIGSSGTVTLNTNDIRIGQYLYHNGDTDTYMKYDTNTITFRAGGTDRLILNGNGADYNNQNIIGVNQLSFEDPGPNEGLAWTNGNFKIYESPDDLTTNTKGNLQIVSGSTRVATFGAVGETALYVEGSGSTVFEVQGSEGQLFSITDDLSGDLFSVSDISGIPIFNVNASGDSYFTDELEVQGLLTGSTGDFSGDVTFGNDITVDNDITLTGEMTIGSGVTLKESADRADLLQIVSSTSTWGGLQITNTDGDGILSLMLANSNGGLYDDQNDDWILYYTENAAVELRYNNVTRIATTSGGAAVTGALTATGDITAYYSSDKRLKENIKPIENATEKVKQLGGYEFDWKKNDDPEMIHEGHDIGVIAQEVEAVLPEIVTDRENGYKAVEYQKLVALLIESNKELAARVEELENKLK